jgi:putative ABC transport system substrate-binding protein
MAAEILVGADPAKMAVQSSDELKLYLNKKAAQNLGLKIPDAVLNRADVIYDEISQ